jgi:hypothetical protein
MGPRFFAFVILAVTLAGPLRAESPAPASSPPPRVTIGFWNIQWFPGGRPSATHGEEVRQVNAVQHDLAELHADIVGMEEVRDFRQADLAVQKLAGFKADVCANFPPREGQTDTQETAIASRLQPLSAWTELWKPNGAMVPPRGFAFAAYEVMPRQLLFVYCVHLKSNRGADPENMAMREEAMRQLRSHIDQMQSAYARLGHIACVVGRRLQHVAGRHAIRAREDPPQFHEQRVQLGPAGLAGKRTHVPARRGRISGRVLRSYLLSRSKAGTSLDREYFAARERSSAGRCDLRVRRRLTFV